MLLLEFLAAQNRTFLNWFREFIRADHRLLPGTGSQAYGHVHRFIRVGWAYLSRSFHRSALTTGK
jgi:hypothetical protein